MTRARAVGCHGSQPCLAIGSLCVLATWPRTLSRASSSGRTGPAMRTPGIQVSMGAAGGLKLIIDSKRASMQIGPDAEDHPAALGEGDGHGLVPAGVI